MSDALENAGQTQVRLGVVSSKAALVQERFLTGDSLYCKLSHRSPGCYYFTPILNSSPLVLFFESIESWECEEQKKPKTGIYGNIACKSLSFGCHIHCFFFSFFPCGFCRNVYFNRLFGLKGVKTIFSEQTTLDYCSYCCSSCLCCASTFAFYQQTCSEFRNGFICHSKESLFNSQWHVSNHVWQPAFLCQTEGFELSVHMLGSFQTMPPFFPFFLVLSVF